MPNEELTDEILTGEIEEMADPDAMNPLEVCLYMEELGLKREDIERALDIHNTQDTSVLNVEKQEWKVYITWLVPHFFTNTTPPAEEQNEYSAMHEKFSRKTKKEKLALISMMNEGNNFDTRKTAREVLECMRAKGYRNKRPRN